MSRDLLNLNVNVVEKSLMSSSCCNNSGRAALEVPPTTTISLFPDWLNGSSHLRFGGRRTAYPLILPANTNKLVNNV